MTRYEHLFFDLDHTLWDFERNSKETLDQLYIHLKLDRLIKSPDLVSTSFSEINRYLWDEYHLDRISKEELRKRRFELVLEQHGVIDEALAEEFSNLYLDLCPSKPHLLPHSLEVLDYLQGKYHLHILSNGFDETTSQKLAASSLQAYFKTICTPSHSGFKKPHSEMFLYALAKASTTIHTSLMIGDDLEADVLGAKKLGMHQVYFNPDKKPHSHTITYEIQSILDLKKIL